ncbi:MAG: metallophosphoesterase [Bacteroidales bacterium]|nr:metallophosphoesterase [Bacteroidales bacterium]MBN2749612.1 metallophosphoesterase [Bacteroidales bacterium]
MMKRYVFRIAMPLVLLFASGCENLIEYSPYEAKVKDGESNLNGKAIKVLAAKSSSEFKPFRFAVIGDSHTYYDDFKDQIAAINRIDSIDFVVHMGDITLSGIYREFMWYRDIIKPLKYPIITLIGNHDCLSNGEFMYKEMFGEFNFWMDYNSCQLVFFDDNIWERNGDDPDFPWLDGVLSAQGAWNHKFVFAHIQPWDQQFSIGNGHLYNFIMDRNDVSLSVHGHTHNYYFGSYYKDWFGNVQYLVSGDSEDREIVLVDVFEDSYKITVRRF